MRRRLLWVAVSLSFYFSSVAGIARKRERRAWVCLLDRGNLPACGHWWHLCVHFQDVLGKPSRKMFRCRQKWSFLEAWEETESWWDSGETMGEQRRADHTDCREFLADQMLFYKNGSWRKEWWGQQERSPPQYGLSPLFNWAFGRCSSKRIPKWGYCTKNKLGIHWYHSFLFFFLFLFFYRVQVLAFQYTPIWIQST